MSEETRVQLLDRWRREGREQEVATFREQVRQECRAEGMTRKEANATAWAKAARRYPPQRQPTETATPRDAHVPLVEPIDKVRWVCRNEFPHSWGDVPSQAPQADEVQWVYENMLLAHEEKEWDRTRYHLELARTPPPSIHALVYLFWAAEDEWKRGVIERLMATCAAEAIRERVKNVIPDWIQRFEIDASHRSPLEGEVCQFVASCMRAAGVPVGTDEG